MYKVFIVSDSYDFFSVLSYIEIECCEKISEVILLEEQHDVSEYKCTNSKLKISYVKTISEGLFLSNFCIVSNEFFDKLQNSNDKLINFNNFKIPNMKSMCNTKTTDADVPNILIISYGKYTQEISLALSIASLIYQNNGYAFLEFSNNLIDLAMKLRNIGLSNHNSVFKSDGYDVKISIAHIDNFYDYQQDYYLQNIMTSVSPDVIILNTNKMFDKDYAINRMFEYKYGKNIDFIIKSKYIPFELSKDIVYPIFCNPSSNEMYDVISLDQNNLMSKITIPDNIYILNK